jgi:hypothetical protein
MRNSTQSGTGYGDRRVAFVNTLVSTSSGRSGAHLQGSDPFREEPTGQAAASRRSNTGNRSCPKSLQNRYSRPKTPTAIRCRRFTDTTP